MKRDDMLLIGGAGLGVGLLAFLIARPASAAAPADGRVPVASFRAKATGYFPFADAMEGGFNDRQGHPLRTLQAYIAGGHTFGDGDYVAVAMDPTAFAYGTVLESPEVNAHYNRRVEFRVVDTGGAFYGKGTTRVDICNATHADTMAPLVNGNLTFNVFR